MFTDQANILAIIIAAIALCSSALADDAADSIGQLSTSAVGNPFVGGRWHYPACGRNFPDKLPVWVFAVHEPDAQSSDPNANLSVSAFSSSDMHNWEHHDNILDLSGFEWANAALKSPVPVYRNGKYYLYFSATGYPPEAAADERTVGNYSGIGVAVSDKPEGPYKNPLPDNTALIPADDPTITNPYGPDVLVDTDGAYMYYGSTGSLEIRDLNDDMTSFANDSKLIAASPGNYEGVRIFKKDSNYHLLWNDIPLYQPALGASASRNIRYAFSKNKNGPFLGGVFTLSADQAIAHTVYHGDVMNPADKSWFLLYSRTQTIPGYKDMIHGLAFERMFFEPDDQSITPVAMRFRNNFQSEYKLNKNNLPLGVDSPTSSSLSVKPDPDNKFKSYLQLDATGTPEVVHAMTYTSFSDFELAVQVSFDEKADNFSSAGAIFRAKADDDSFEKWTGYVAEYNGNGTLVLSKIEPGTGILTGLGRNDKLFSGKKMDKKNRLFYLKVRAEGSSIKVYAAPDATYDEPAIKVEDKTWSVGWTGFRAHRAVGKFSSVEVTRIRSIVNDGFALSGSDKGNPWLDWEYHV
ncbi:Glycosyl hydrolase, five-bladed beta-propellor domain containing protein [Rhypophila sp. PSN 637]